MSEEKKYKAAVIGAGMIPVRGHIPAYKRLENVNLVAICDINAARAQEVAEAADIPNVYTDYREMLAEEDLDLVSVCTPNVFHAEMSIAALKSGANVICEKPMALTYSDAQAMVEAAEEAGKQLTIAFTQRPRPEMSLLHQYAEEDRFGDIYYVKAQYLRRSGIPGYGSWFTNRDLAGGGATYDIGVHFLDLALWIMGHPKPISVTASTYAEFGPRAKGLGGWGADILEPPQRFDVDDFLTCHVKFENGATLVLEVSWAAYLQSGHRLQILGTEMGADFYPSLYGADQPLRLYDDMNDEQIEIIPERPRPSDLSGHQALVEDWVKHLDDKEAPVPAWHGAMSVQILEAAFQSAESGESIQLNQE
jgi:predicted dehydrogenase